MTDFPNSDLQFYVDRLYEGFLISRKIPCSIEEENEIKKIASSLSILSWISQSQLFCLDEEAKIIESIKELSENFKQSQLNEKIKEIIQGLKNINESLKFKTQILEHFSELEYKGCLDKKIRYPLDQSSLNEKFKKIIIHIKENFEEKNQKNLIELMKLERDVKEIKQKYLNGFSKEEEIEKLFNLLVNKSQFRNP